MQRKQAIALLIGVFVVSVVIGGYSVVNASSSGDGGNATGPEADAAATAALAIVGSGTVLEVEHADDPGATWEVEIRSDDGQEIEVLLDSNLGHLSTGADDSDGPGDDDSGKDDD